MTSFSTSDPASKLQAAHPFMRLAATHVLSSLGLMRKRSVLKENQQIKSGYFIPPHETWRARSSLLHWYATSRFFPQNLGCYCCISCAIQLPCLPLKASSSFFDPESLSPSYLPVATWGNKTQSKTKHRFLRPCLVQHKLLSRTPREKWQLKKENHIMT